MEKIYKNKKELYIIYFFIKCLHAVIYLKQSKN